MRRLSGVVAGLALLLASRGAWALGPVELGVGTVVTGGINTIDQPGASSFTVADQTGTYPGFSGTTGGAGVMLEARFWRRVGVVFNPLFSWDFGSGRVTQGDRSADVTIGQRAVHVPVLLKGVLPTSSFVSPFVEAGPEFVLPLPSKVESERPVRGVVGTARYTMATVGVGAELKVPVAPLDLRLSLALRGSYRLGSTDDLAERATPLPSGAIIFDGRWRYQVLGAASLGVFF